MVPDQTEFRADGRKSRLVVWAGRSGRRYTLSEAGPEALADGRLYVLAEQECVRWAGTARDLISDQASRALFRKWTGGGATLLSLAAPDDETALMTLIWDLEGSRRLGRSAA